MTATAVLEDLARKGVAIWADGDTIRYRGPRGILTPGDMESLRQNKPEILRLLAPSPKPQATPVPREADDLEARCELGARMKRGEIAAVRCGITGFACRNCQGVACPDSTPWVEATPCARAAAIPTPPNLGVGQEAGRASNAN